MYPDIESVEGLPEIDKVYMVSAVPEKCTLNISLCNVIIERRKYTRMIPILTPSHDDIYYGFGAQTHWHYDFRFMLPSDFRNFRPNVSPFFHVTLDNGTKEIKRSPFRCMRQMPEIDKFAHDFYSIHLFTAFRDKHMNPEVMKCPHHGTCLKGLPVNNGAVTCPAHGLIWNITTGAFCDTRPKARRAEFI